ncbi:MAG: T9SS type A sorting domain-containing protein [Crocinitomicaceae bacterium]|nr:T9SS type A sorting domain-containing protein [Crocinitomicaceae bacterium]
MQFKSIFFLFILLASSATTAQVTIAPGAIQSYESPAVIISGESVYRTHKFVVTAGTFTGEISLTHQSTPTPVDWVNFEAFHILSSPNDLLPPAVNYDQSNTLTTTLAGATSHEIIPSTGTLTSSFFTGGVSTSVTFNISSTSYIYIVEEFSTVPCYDGSPLPNLVSSLLCQFNEPGGQPIDYPVSGSIDLYASPNSIWVETLLASNQSSTNPSSNYLSDFGANCDVKQISRKLHYELTSGSPLIDPYFSIDLNGAETQLLEIDPADVLLNIHIVTDEFGGFIEALNVPLTSMSLPLRDVQRQDNAGSDIPLAPLDYGPLENVAFITQPGVNPSTMSTVPSLATPSSSGINVLQRIDLHLSNLNLGANYNTTTAYTTYGSSTDPIQRLMGYISAFPGSYIEVDYIGTFVPAADFHPDWDNHVENIPNLNIQEYTISGFNSCQDNVGITGGNTFIHEQNNFGFIGNPMFGDNDFFVPSWDGDTQIISADLSIPLNDNFLANARAALDFDYACSFIEFVVEMEQGMSVICPGSVDGTTIEFINGGQSCTTPNFTDTDCFGSISAPEIFKIDLGFGDIVEADHVTIEPLNGNCSEGQKWTIRMPLDRFRSDFNSNMMADATLLINVQAYCPSLEPGPPIRLKTYIIPGKCDQGATTFSGPTYTQGTQTYNTINCTTQCLTSDCDNNRFKIGESEGLIFVNCPGCNTPGASIQPGVVLHERHSDFVGFGDDDDDGIRNSVLPADTMLIDRQMLRHGDVMTSTVNVNFFDGMPYTINPTEPDAFMGVNLFTPNTTDCPSLQQVILDKMVLEITGTGEFGANLSNTFCPIITDAGANSNALQFNDDVLINNGLAEYTQLRTDYPSDIILTVNGTTHENHPMQITDNMVVWLNESEFRIVVSLDDVNAHLSLFNLTSYSLEYLTQNLSMKFRLQFVTDSDISPIDWASTAEKNKFEFFHFAYGTGALADDLLGTTNAPVVLGDHASEYCDALADQTWWCEKGYGLIWIARYEESKFMQQNLGVNYKIFLDPIADGISPCAEISSVNSYKAGIGLGTHGNGGQAFRSRNLFPNEIRNPSLPETIDLYVPAQFAPEAIIIDNWSKNYPIRYAGATSSIDIVSVIPLDLDNLTGPYGITISMVDMPDYLTPMYPDMSQFSNPMINPINGSGTVEGDPIFDPIEATDLLHYKISIPIEALGDYSSIQSGLALNGQHHANDLIPASPNGSFPIYVTDETLFLHAAIVYTMPTCSVTNPDPAGDPDFHTPHPYTTQEEESDYYSEQFDNLYYDGNPYHLLYLGRTSETIQTLQPVVETTPGNGDYAIGAADYSAWPVSHPRYDLDLKIPNRIKLIPAINADQSVTTISSQVAGIDNHPLDYSIYANPTQAEMDFSGIFPACPLVTKAYTLYPHLYNDQRSDMSLAAINSSVDVELITSEIEFLFEISNEHLNMLNPFAGPSQTYSDMGVSTNAEFLAATGATQNQPYSHINNTFVPWKYNFDINNLYFYLKPLLSPSGAILNLDTDIEIISVSQTGSPNTDYDFTTVGSPVAAGSGSQPRLFYIGDADVPSASGSTYTNVSGHIVTVRAKFNCSSSEMLELIDNDITAAGGTVQLPFDVIVNYNCDALTQTWQADNASNLMTDPSLELTYADAQGSRCSNDELTPHYNINIPQIDYDVTVSDVSTDPCDAQFEITVQNTLNAPFNLALMNIAGMPPMFIPPAFITDGINNCWGQISGWSYEYIGQASEMASGSESVSFFLNLDYTGCISESFSFDVEVLTESYCGDCNGDPSCLISRIESGTFNYGIGYSGSDVLGFNSYDPFASGLCATILNGDMEIYINSIIEGVDYLTNVNTYDYEFNFTLDDGTTSYTFNSLWSNGTTLNNFIESISNSGLNLCGGSLQLTLNDITLLNLCDGVECNIIQDVNISCTVAIETLAISAILTDATCNVGGSIDIEVVGGTAPYTYAWSNGPVSQDITNLLAGIYDVTVTDANDCEVTGSYTLNGSDPIVASWVAESTSCYGNCDGEIVVTASGGNGGYTFGISGVIDPPQSSNILTGLCAGNYTIEILDQFGCSLQFVASVDDAPLLYVENNAIITDVTCNGGNDGSIDIEVSGGTPPYTYAWSNTATTQDVANLLAGTYTVTVTDANGCQATATYTISEPSQANIVLIPSVYNGGFNVSCNGGSDGEISAQITNGTPPYTYNWSTNTSSVLVQGVLIQTDLLAGIYILEIIDELGCASHAQITLEQPEDPLAIIDDNVVSTCENTSSGSIDILVDGGTPVYTFSWTEIPSGLGTYTFMGEDPTNMPGGTFEVIITDANGCIYTDTYTILEVAYPVVTGVVSNICGDGCDGEIDVTTTPLGSYTYDWTSTVIPWTNQTTEDLFGLCVGDYTVSATNSTGCTTEETFVIEQVLSSSSFIATSQNPPNFCTVDFDFIQNVQGGTVSLVEWDFGDGSPLAYGFNVTHTFLGANGAPQTYVVTATYTIVSGINKCGSSYSEIITVQCPPLGGDEDCNIIDVSFDKDQPPLSSLVTFTDNIQVGVGTTVIAKHWNFGDGSATITVPGSVTTVVHDYLGYPLAPYTVTLTVDAAYDNILCSEVEQNTYKLRPYENKLKPHEKPLKIVIIPNPTDGEFTIEGNFQSEEYVNVVITTAVGKKVVESRYSVGRGINIDLRNQPPGVYLITVQDGSESYQEKIVIY